MTSPDRLTAEERLARYTSCSGKLLGFHTDDFLREIQAAERDAERRGREEALERAAVVATQYAQSGLATAIRSLKSAPPPPSQPLTEAQKRELARLDKLEQRMADLEGGHDSNKNLRHRLDDHAERLRRLESAASPRPSKPEGELERAKKDLEHRARWVVEEWRAIPPGVYPGAARLGYALVELREAFDRLAAAERGEGKEA